MRIKPSFVTINDGESALTVSTDTKLFSGIIRSNSIGSLIIESLREDTDIEQIVSLIIDEYDIDEKTARSDVFAIIDQLRSVEALEE